MTALGLVLAASGCEGEAKKAPAAVAPTGPLRVATTSVPADWLVRQLAPADLAEVELVIPLGEDPPAWRPPPELISRLGEYDLIVANGAGFEAWMKTASLPPSRLVRSARGSKLLELPGVRHTHGGGEHSHAGTDPHTWSDPLLFAEQAERVAGALKRVRPERAADVKARLARLVGELKKLQAEQREAIQAGEGTTPPDLAQSHPAFNYLARRHGLKLETFLLDPEELPPDDVKATVLAWARGRVRPVLLWEAPPSAAVQAALPGLRHVTLDPLEQPAEGKAYDYLAQARRNVEVLGALFDPSAADLKQKP